ncbi:MAG: peptidoglycan DD-metalloendopeptidase family protein [Proteobacteria bacterium]|nr:peptidoglycan DD-metalloendopeptidase family protein [Pseudomonadota bacterium]
MKTIFILLLLLPSGSISFANETSLPRHQPVPGGVATIKLDWKYDGRPQAYFNNEPLLVTRLQGTWYALAGIGLDVKPGDHDIQVNEKDGAISKYTIAVKDKKYPAQYLKIKNRRYVEPQKKDVERILREKDEIAVLLATFSPGSNNYYRLEKPVKGRLSSRFGLKRFFNGKPRRPHSGLDIAAKRGTAINAPLSGRIIGVGNYFFSGNIIFLDHGQGMITTYSHLNRVNVKPGQEVNTGDKLGEVGSTGRVTGPHLHWSVYLNKARIDPALFL